MKTAAAIHMLIDPCDANCIQWNHPAFEFQWPESPTDTIKHDAGYPGLALTDLEPLANH